MSSKENFGGSYPICYIYSLEVRKSLSSTCWPWAARRWSVNLTGISTEKNVLDQMMRRIRRSPRTSYSDKILGHVRARSHLHIGRDGVPRPDASRARWRKFCCISFSRCAAGGAGPGHHRPWRFGRHLRVSRSNIRSDWGRTGRCKSDVRALLLCGPGNRGLTGEYAVFDSGACPAVGVSINRRQSSSSRSLSSSPRCRRSAFSVDQRMPFITFWAAM